MDRHEHEKQKLLGGQSSFQTQRTTWTTRAGDEPGSSLRAGLRGFPYSLMHLTALALCMIGTQYILLHTKETKFRA